MEGGRRRSWSRVRPRGWGGTRASVMRSSSTSVCRRWGLRRWSVPCPPSCSEGKRRRRQRRRSGWRRSTRRSWRRSLAQVAEKNRQVILAAWVVFGCLFGSGTKASVLNVLALVSKEQWNASFGSPCASLVWSTRGQLEWAIQTFCSKQKSQIRLNGDQQLV